MVATSHLTFWIIPPEICQKTTFSHVFCYFLDFDAHIEPTWSKNDSNPTRKGAKKAPHLPLPPGGKALTELRFRNWSCGFILYNDIINFMGAQLFKFKKSSFLVFSVKKIGRLVCPNICLAKKKIRLHKQKL